MGITEETDAVVVVISEERGEISLCVKGNIARDLEKDTLRVALQDLFDEDQSVDVAKEAEAAAQISKASAANIGKGLIQFLTDLVLFLRPAEGHRDRSAAQEVDVEDLLAPAHGGGQADQD